MPTFPKTVHMSHFYHGSMTALTPGLVLRGRGDAYTQEWAHMAHYAALHQRRPAAFLAHHQAVFMCTDIDDIDCCGGGTEFVCLMRPLGPVSRHDLNWTSHIQCLLEDPRMHADHPNIVAACLGYWNGAPCPEGEQVWEHLTPAAQVLACHPYEDLDADIHLAAQARAFHATPAP